MISGFDFSSYDTMDSAGLQAQTLTRDIYFAYLRASHGLSDDGSYLDARRDCDRVAVLNGAYHFVMPNEDIGQQVTHFKNQVSDVLAGNLPPCLDFEWTLKKDKNGNIIVPEYWDPIKPADRIKLMKSILQKAESALGTVPAIYTHPLFWRDYVIAPNPGADVGFFARYPLWLVDLHGTAAIPQPWTKASFVQNSFGENAPPGSPWYDTMDHDFFNGRLIELLALTYPGLALSMSASPPVSAIVRDCQAALNALHINVGTADGRFGAKTKTGVQQFQTSQGLNPTGQLDIPTLRKLLP
jgi:GH25 family lysozyme M1 (1,4-beta-N-acetylmuramidase)